MNDVTDGSLANLKLDGCVELAPPHDLHSPEDVAGLFEVAGVGGFLSAHGEAPSVESKGGSGLEIEARRRIINGTAAPSR